MKKLFLTSGLFIVALLFYIALSGCSKQEDGEKLSVTTSSEEAKADFFKGRELFEKLRQRESLEYFENALQKDNKLAMAYYYHALANPTAKGFFEDLNNAVVNLDGITEGEKLIILALKSGVDGNQKKQEEYLKKLVEIHPFDERAQGQLGQFYFAQQNYQLAVDYLSNATEIDPQFSSAYNMLGYSYRNLGDYVEAEKAFKKYIELIPDDPNPYDSYAEMLSKQGRYEESIEQYQKAIELNPGFFASHMGISNNLIYLNRHDEAIKNCENSYNLAQNDGERRFALFTKTVALVDAGKTMEALLEMQKQYDIAAAINDAGAMSGDLIAMGNILFNDGRYEEAASKFDDALNLIEASDLAETVKDNNRRLNLYNRGIVELMIGNMENAKKLADEFTVASEKANNTFQKWQAHFLNGLIAMKEKDFNKAISEFKNSNLQNPQTYYYLAQAYAQNGNKNEARNYADKCANFNALVSLNQAFVRNKAEKMIASL